MQAAKKQRILERIFINRTVCMCVCVCVCVCVPRFSGQVLVRLSGCASQVYNLSFFAFVDLVWRTVIEHGGQRTVMEGGGRLERVVDGVDRKWCTVVSTTDGPRVCLHLRKWPQNSPFRAA